MNLYICTNKVCERYRIEILQPLLVDGCSHLPSNVGDCFIVMEQEIWDIIDASSGRYEVSNYGRIRRAKTKRILKESETRGYKYASMWFGNKRVRKAVHVMVAKAFVANPNNLPQVNHKDEDPSNNRADNLEWCTASYNSSYGTRNERMLVTRKMNNRITRERPVLRIYGEEIKEYKSIMEASRDTGVDFSNIAKCCRENCYNRTAGGYKWEYADK